MPVGLALGGCARYCAGLLDSVLQSEGGIDVPLQRIGFILSSNSQLSHPAHSLSLPVFAGCAAPCLCLTIRDNGTRQSRWEGDCRSGKPVSKAHTPFLAGMNANDPENGSIFRKLTRKVVCYLEENRVRGRRRMLGEYPLYISLFEHGPIKSL